MNAAKSNTGSDALASVLNFVSENPQIISTISNFLGTRNAKEGGGGIKIPDGLFDDLPESEADIKDAEDAEKFDGAEKVTPNAQGGTPISIPPELLAKLPDIISAAKPVMQAIESYRADLLADGARERRESIPADKRNALLLALKPYINEHRQHTVDIIVSVSKFSSVLHFNGK